MTSRRNGVQSGEVVATDIGKINKSGSSSPAGILSLNTTKRRKTVAGTIMDNAVTACIKSSSKLIGDGGFPRVAPEPKSSLRSKNSKRWFIWFFAFLAIIGLGHHFMREDDEDILALQAELEKIPKKTVPSPKAIPNPRKTAWANDDDVNEDSKKGGKSENPEGNEDEEADDDDKAQAVQSINGMIWGGKWSTRYDDDTVKNKEDHADIEEDDDDEAIGKEEAKTMT